MGETLTASCDCGFSITINAGRGFIDTGIYYLPALCEECHQFIVADYNNPQCPSCGKRPIFYGEMDHKFFNFIPYAEKHELVKKTSFRRYSDPSLSLAAPNAANEYWCAKCEKKSLRFRYEGFWE